MAGHSLQSQGKNSEEERCRHKETADSASPTLHSQTAKWIVAEAEKLGYESADEFNAAAPAGFEQAASEAQAVGQGDSQDGVDPSSAENPSGAQGGTGSVDSPDLRAEARRVQSVSGAEIIFYTDGDARVGGFTPKSNPELIFIWTDRTEIALANSLAHKFRFPVAIGKTYRIEDSTDLVTWGTVESGIVGAGGQVQRFYSILNVPKRYFRVEEDAP